MPDVTQGTPSPAVSMDFASLGAQAKEMIAANPVQEPTLTTPPAATVTPSENLPTPQPLTSQQQTPAITGTPTPAEAKIYELNLGNGRVEKLTEEQLRDAYQNGLRQSDYTRKTQELARHRAEVEGIIQQVQAQQQQYQAEVNYARQLLNNPQMLIATAQQYIQAQQPQTPLDPNSPVTVAQTQQMAQGIAQRLQAIEQGMVQRITDTQHQAEQYVQRQMEVAKYSESINGTLSKLYTDQPILKAVPEFEDVLRFRVAQLQPQSIEETIQAFQTVGKELAGQVAQNFNNAQQVQVAQRATLSAQGIEPPGGAAPQPTQQSYTKNGKIDWNSLQNAALSQVKGL